MKHTLNGHIAYLEDTDFDDKGDLTASVLLHQNKPIVVMIQASWCGFCNKAKPAFQTFADTYVDKVLAATIHIDGDKESEQLLGKRINIIKPDCRGFPDYILFDENGKRVDKQLTSRSVDGLVEFAGV